MKNIDLFRNFKNQVVKKQSPDFVYLFDVIDTPKLLNNNGLMDFLKELFICYGEKYTTPNTSEYKRAIRIYETCIDEGWAVAEFVEHTKNFIRSNTYANFTIADFFKEPRPILYTKDGHLKEYIKDPYITWRMYEVNNTTYWQKANEPHFTFLDEYLIKPITEATKMLPKYAETKPTTIKEYVKGLWLIGIDNKEITKYVSADELPKALELYAEFSEKQNIDLQGNAEMQIKALFKAKDARKTEKG